MIECLSSWLTPTVLFCILNLLIVTILITSIFRNNERKQQQQEEDEEQLPRTPSLLHRVRSVNFSFPDPFNSPLTTHHFLDNSPFFLQRIRSINFSFSSQKPSQFPSLDPLDEQPVAAHKDDAEKVDLKRKMIRSKSTMCAEEKEVVVRWEKKLKVGNRHHGGTKSFGNEEEDAVDKKADDFINKFRKQLKMQRIHSILNKEMLNRGVSI
ncbi:pathogen-associated molecular patterns-induced protein A70-like [Solanum dulcamara]|uniref:pathogen-associated molecular patterns-induced protein A70-like n=1 Tax=Solanum dulcamara TaxID=45834 RepID=UPI0024857594|nr:pathogen-associated molecular patterns-induced protein A70-like [Solanum dulcamara]